MASSCARCTENTATSKVTRVMIIDDSPLMCRALEHILQDDPGIEVAGCAHSGMEALELLRQKACDICTLDVHMPGMNGITVLKHIMVKHPMPTLMVSAFTSDGARITFDALRYGAVDFFQKPSNADGKDLAAQAEALRNKIKAAARVKVEAARYLRLKLVSRKEGGKDNPRPHGMAANIISTSTGGYSSLLSLLPCIDASLNGPVLIFHGIEDSALTAFMDYLRSYVKLPITRANDQDELSPGTIYFLGKGETAAFEQQGGKWILNVSKRPDLPGREGPVDLALLSASEHFGKNTRAVFLSGDEEQGFTGAKEVLRNGGAVLIQRPATCLSPDVPEQLLRELDTIGAREVNLPEIAEIISEDGPRG